MIAHRLHALAQLRSHRTFLRSLFTVVAAVLAALFLVAAVDVAIGLPWVMRLVTVAAIAVGGVLTIRRGLAMARKLAARDAARLVELAHPDLGQSVRTAAQVAPQLRSESPALEAALVDQTTQRLLPLPLDEEVAPRRTMLPAVFATAAIALCWIIQVALSPDWRTAAGRALGFPISFTRISASANPERVKADETVQIVAVLSGRTAAEATAFLRSEGENWRELVMAPTTPQRFSLMLPGLVKTVEFYVRAGDGRSPVQRIAVHISPTLRTLDMHLDYPAYTGFPPTDAKGGDIEAIEGTTARVEMEFDRPVAKAQVLFSDGTLRPIALEGLRGHVDFVLAARNLTWRVVGRDASGEEFENVPHQCKGIEDKLPVVKLAEPRDDVEVTPLQELLARVQARDDVGLASIGLVMQIGTKAETVLEKKFEALDVRQAAELATAYLETHHLTLNDSLLIHAYATDHKPRNGAKAVSPMVAIDVREFQRRFRLGEVGECKCVNLVEKMIAQERRIFSDTNQLKELSAAQEAPKALVLPLMERQGKVIAIAPDVAASLEMLSGSSVAEAKEALQKATEQMESAAARLKAIQLAEAVGDESAALASLLQLRQQMLYKFSKGKGSAHPVDKRSTTKDERPSLTDLAAKVEQIAGEEKDVAAQAQALSPETKTPPAVLRQQEAAAGDLGEILSEIDSHPATSDALRDRGQQADAGMQAATKTLSAEAARAAEPLSRAENSLRELAEHMRALEQPLDDKALEKLAQNADKAAECLSECAQCVKGSGRGKTGSGSGEGELSSPPKTPAYFVPQIGALSGQAVVLDDTLRRWSGEGEETPQGAGLRGLREAQRIGRMAEELRMLQKSVAKNSAPDPVLAAEAERLAKGQESIAAAMRKERDAMRATRAQQLTALRRKVQELAGEAAPLKPGAPASALEPSVATREQMMRRLPTAEGEKLLADLRGSGDRDLQLLTDSIVVNRQRPVLAWRALRNTDARLAVLLAELKRVPPIAVRETKVPDNYRRLLQNYFEALSDDFGDEEKDTPAASSK